MRHIALVPPRQPNAERSEHWIFLKITIFLFHSSRKKDFAERFFAKRSGEHFKRGVRLCRTTRRMRSAATTSVREKSVSSLKLARDDIRRQTGKFDRRGLHHRALLRGEQNDGAETVAARHDGHHELRRKPSSLSLTTGMRLPPSAALAR